MKDSDSENFNLYYESHLRWPFMLSTVGMLRKSNWGPFWPCPTWLGQKLTPAQCISHGRSSCVVTTNLTVTLIQTLPLLTQLLGSLVSSFPGQVLKIQSNLLPLATLFFSRWKRRLAHFQLLNKQLLQRSFSPDQLLSVRLHIYMQQNPK